MVWVISRKICWDLHWSSTAGLYRCPTCLIWILSQNLNRLTGCVVCWSAPQLQGASSLRPQHHAAGHLQNVTLITACLNSSRLLASSSGSYTLITACLTPRLLTSSLISCTLMLQMSSVSCVHLLENKFNHTYFLLMKSQFHLLLTIFGLKCKWYGDTECPHCWLW